MSESAANIPQMVETIRSGGALSSEMGDPIMRLHLAVVRYVNELGPGDVPDEYAAVVEAMRSDMARPNVSMTPGQAQTLSAANRQESVTAEDVKRMAQWALDLEAALRNVIDYLEGSDLSADHMKAKQLRDVLEGDSLV